MKPLSAKKKLSTYRKVLKALNKRLCKDDKRECGNYIMFICNQLELIYPTRNTCSPQQCPQNNMVFNYPEITKHKPENAKFGDMWWDYGREELLIRINVLETAIAEVLANNPDLL